MCYFFDNLFLNISANLRAAVEKTKFYKGLSLLRFEHKTRATFIPIATDFMFTKSLVSLLLLHITYFYLRLGNKLWKWPHASHVVTITAKTDYCGITLKLS